MSRGARGPWSLIESDATRLSEAGDLPLWTKEVPYDRAVRCTRSGLAVTAAVLAVGIGALAGTFMWSTSVGAARAPLPAGPHPSEIAKEPCQSVAQHEIADALGVKGTVSDKAWIDHRYSCNYVYRNGTFTLSIQELSSWDQTYAYFHKLGHELGDVGKLLNLGQGAFQTTDGSVVVRKDWKVLLVNVANLPPNFGVPATLSKYVAVTIADVILGCWAGD
jgi:hypothetical protein